MSKPDPAITADLLSKLPARKPGQAKAVAAPSAKDHASRPQPMGARVSSRSAEKSTVPGRTRTSNRGK